MIKPVLASYLFSDFVFLATGVMLITVATVWRNEIASPPTKESVGRLILLEGCPLIGRWHPHATMGSVLADFGYSRPCQWSARRRHLPDVAARLRPAHLSHLAQDPLVGRGPVPRLHPGPGAQRVDPDAHHARQSGGHVGQAEQAEPEPAAAKGEAQPGCWLGRAADFAGRAGLV